MPIEMETKVVAVLVKGFALHELRINDRMVATAIGIARVENMSNSFATYRIAIKDNQGFVKTQFYVDEFRWETI